MNTILVTILVILGVWTYCIVAILLAIRGTKLNKIKEGDPVLLPAVVGILWPLLLPLAIWFCIPSSWSWRAK